MDLASLLLPLIAVLMFFAVIVLHEFGHLICGILTGYRFNRFQIGWFVWHKEDNKIKFKATKALAIFSAGQCSMIPPKDYKDFKMFWHYFGGVFFNLLAILAAVFFMVFMDLNELGSSIINITIAVNLIFVVINLFPKGNTDGEMLYMAIKSDDN